MTAAQRDRRRRKRLKKQAASRRAKAFARLCNFLGLERTIEARYGWSS